MSDQGKKPAQRLFTGVVGSSLGNNFRVPAPAATPKKLGRPRKHVDEPAKKRAYRSRKAQESNVAAALLDHKDSKGRLRNESSGYGSKIGSIQDAVEFGADGKKGGGPLKNANWEFDAGYKHWLTEQITEELVRKHFTIRTDSYLCTLCDFLTDFFKEAAEHLSIHGSIELMVKQAIKEGKRSKGPKKSRCPESLHVFRADQLRLASEKQKVFCGDCRKLIYAPPSQGIS